MDPQPHLERAQRVLGHSVHAIDALAAHPLWSALRDRPAIARFMESHVYCVWDFMSLLKSLQSAATATAPPWRPVGSARARRLVNEIVLVEESDRLPGGRLASHLELYLAAMAEVGADRRTFEGFLADLGPGGWTPGDLAPQIDRAAARTGVPPEARTFIGSTFATIDRGRPWEIAAAFSIGRERVIPAMFAASLARGRVRDFALFAEYLDRHVETDGAEHGPMSLELVAELCGTDDARWDDAAGAAAAALESRRRLWDALLADLEAGERTAGRPDSAAPQRDVVRQP